MGVLLDKIVCASLLLAGGGALQTGREEGQKWTNNWTEKQPWAMKEHQETFVSWHLSQSSPKLMERHASFK